jgi:hypothetical protein
MICEFTMSRLSALSKKKMQKMPFLKSIGVLQKKLRNFQIDIAITLILKI